MSISVEYYCSRAELCLSLLIRWLILPIRWLAILNNRELPSGGQADVMRKAVRDSLPVSTYGELATAEEERTTTCAVCLGEVQGEDRLWELRNCNHVFHNGCLDTSWLDHDEHLTCPLCRAPLMTPVQAQRGPLTPLLYLFGDDLQLS